MNSIRTILEIEGITKRFYGKAINDYSLVLKGLDLEILRGKITALIGANGAGKTTLFNIISGLSKPESGSVTYYDSKGNGHYLVRLSAKNKAKSIFLAPHQIANLGIGRLFQDLRIFKNMSLIENVMIASKERDGELPFTSFFDKNAKVVESQRLKRATELINQILSDTFSQNTVGKIDKQVLLNDNHNSLTSFLNRFSFIFNFKRFGDVFGPPIMKSVQEDIFLRDANDFSFGQQRLISMAALFMGNHDLLLLDEPTAGVNPEIIEKILKILRQTVEESGKTILMIEHNMDVVLKIADYCYFMDEGKITHFGSPDDVLGNPSVRREYLGL